MSLHLRLSECPLGGSLAIRDRCSVELVESWRDASSGLRSSVSRKLWDLTCCADGDLACCAGPTEIFASETSRSNSPTPERAKFSRSQCADSLRNVLAEYSNVGGKPASGCLHNTEGTFPVRPSVSVRALSSRNVLGDIQHARESKDLEKTSADNSRSVLGQHSDAAGERNAGLGSHEPRLRRELERQVVLFYAQAQTVSQA